MPQAVLPGLARARQDALRSNIQPAPLRRRWRAALGCETCADSKRVPCPNCDAKGGYLAMGGTTAVCKACRGTGRVVCRECFTGDGFDIESIRRQMGYPD